LDAKGWNGRKRRTDEWAPVWRWFGYLVAIFALDILIVAALAVPNYLDTGDLRQLFVLTYPYGNRAAMVRGRTAICWTMRGNCWRMTRT
jgi:hypothetical protein